MNEELIWMGRGRGEKTKKNGHNQLVLVSVNKERADGAAEERSGMVFARKRRLTQ